MSNRLTNSEVLDGAAVVTMSVVEKACRVRNLTIPDAVELVATETGATVSQVETMLRRALGLKVAA